MKCARFKPDGGILTLTTLPTRGGGGGAPGQQPDQCGFGSLVNGLRFTFTNYNRQVRKIILECRPINGGDPGEVAIGVVNDGQSPHDHICPVHQVAVGVRVNWGKHVNALGIVCDSEPVRTLPSPSELRKFRKCDDYAKSADNQTVAAGARSCDVDKRAGRWQVNYRGHFDWCWSMTEGNDLTAKEKSARAGLLSRCSTLPSPGGGKAAASACNVSAVVRNTACKNLDGTPSTILAPGTLTATGCGASEAQAVATAKAIFSSQAALADRPSNGACTYDVQTINGCRCR